MKNYILTICLIFFITYAYNSYATYAVFDAQNNVLGLLKAKQDSLYQELALGQFAEEVGLTKNNLETAMKSLQTAREYLGVAQETYDMATVIRNNIGDPQAIVSYLNANYIQSDNIDDLMRASDIVKQNINSPGFDVTNPANLMNQMNGSMNQIEWALKNTQYNLDQLNNEKIKRDTAESLAKAAGGRSGKGSIADMYNQLKVQAEQYDPRTNGSMTNALNAIYQSQMWYYNFLAQEAIRQNAFREAELERLEIENQKDRIAREQEKLALQQEENYKEVLRREGDVTAKLINDMNQVKMSNWRK